MAPDQPQILELRLDMAGCAGDVILNGVSQFRNWEGRPAVLQVPVSGYWRPGRNTVGMRLWSNTGAFADPVRCRVDLVTRTKGAPKAQHSVVTTVELPTPLDLDALPVEPPVITPSTLGPVSERQIAREPGSTRTIRVIRRIEPSMNAIDWAWANAMPFDGPDQANAALAEGYDRVWRAFRSGRLDEVRTVLSEMLTESGRAYAMTPEELIGIMELDEITTDRATYVLEPLETGNVKLELSDDQRLASWTVRRGGYSPICWDRTEPPGFVDLRVWFRREGDRVVVAR